MKSDFVGIEEADLISSEAKPKISSELCEDFTVRSTISLNIRVAILYYELIMVQQFCTLTQKSLISGAFRVFRGQKYPSFTSAPFLEPFGLEPLTISHL